MGMYEQLLDCGYVVHTGHDGWWLGRDHELWVLSEQKRMYGDCAVETPEIRAALAILTEQNQNAA